MYSFAWTAHGASIASSKFGKNLFIINIIVYDELWQWNNKKKIDFFPLYLGEQLNKNTHEND
jgi:hypothetical protein